MYQQHLENILTYMHEKYPEELDKSRRWFFEQTGEVYEGDEFFEERISNQLDWFAFDWRNDATEIPIRTYINEKSWSLTPEDVESLEKMCNPVHSIFEVKKINPKKNLLVLFDLIARRKYEVFERRALHGIEKKNIFEARLIPSGEQYIMMNAFVMHPPEAGKFIKKRIKRMLKDGTKNFKPLMIMLQKMWMHMYRYTKVDIKLIYSDKFMDEYFHGVKLPPNQPATVEE